MKAREARVRRRTQLDLLAAMMREPAGREYLRDFLAACRVYQTSFATNALAMAFAEGERNTGLRLLNDLVEASPDLYMTMLKEGNSERATARVARDDDDRDSDDRDGNDGTGFA